MIARQKETYDRGHRVTVTGKAYAATIGSFGPLQEAYDRAAHLTAALDAKSREQDTDTKAEAEGKEAQRELLARAASTLSVRMVSCAKAKKKPDWEQKFHVTYTQVRYGGEDQDVHRVKQLLEDVALISGADRSAFRITEELVQQVQERLDGFLEAEEKHERVKALVRLATLRIPGLVKELLQELGLIKTLLAGMKDEDATWRELWQVFSSANKRHKVAPSHHKKAKVRTVHTLVWTQGDNRAKNLGKKKYRGNYRFVVENTSNSEVSLWMVADRSGTPGEGYAPVVCAPGVVTELTRSEVGPELAQYLFGRYEAPEGGSVRIKVRKVRNEG